MITIDAARSDDTTELSLQGSPPARSALAPLVHLLRFATAIAFLLAVASFPRSALLTVREITVAGTHQVPAAEVIARSGLRFGEPLFAIPTRQITERLTRHPRIATAQVRIAPPGHVWIRITERLPAAALSYGGGFLLLDHAGIVLAQEADPSGLPVISVHELRLPWVRLGDRPPAAEPTRTLRAMQMLPPTVFREGTRVHMTGDGDLVMTSDDGITVLLGQPSALRERAAALAQILEALREKRLAVDYLDLRFAGSVIVKPKAARPAPRGVGP